MESIWSQSVELEKRASLKARKSRQNEESKQNEEFKQNHWETQRREVQGEQKPLSGNQHIRTIVIGAGIAGILTAYFLKKRGHEVIVVEARRIASGQTRNTTAKITSQHGMIYHKLIHKIGREKAKAYAQANEAAIGMYEQIIKEENISCHFEKLPAYLYTVEETGKEKLRKEAFAASSLGLPAYFVEGKKVMELPFTIKGAVCFENQAQFHPLEFIKQLAKELIIYEDTKVLSVKKHRILTNRGVLEADNIVFATHYPFVNVPGFYFLRQHQERSYVIALKVQKSLSGMYYSIDEKGLSIRSFGDTLLLGGGKHRTGKGAVGESAKENVIENVNENEKRGDCKCIGYSWLREAARKYYPNAKEAGAWSAQDCMPHDGIPFIGRYSLFRPYWYVATGFHKWGMTSAMVAARLITEQICADNQTPKIAEKLQETLFSPRRFYFRAAIKNLLVDIGESVMGLSKGFFGKKERRCPHMGCRLEWNKEEGSWDCPCHGSRFDHTGELMDNPAQVDKKRLL